VNNAVVIAWIVMATTALLVLLVYGRPERYKDKQMARHLWLTTLVAGLEPIGLLLAGLSLIPLLLVYILSVGIMWARLGFLLRQPHTPKEGDS